MKLSFSTKGWDFPSLGALIETAAELKFSGIEFHGAADASALSRNLFTAGRELAKNGLSVACIDSLCDISTCSGTAAEEIERSLSAAAELSSPYIRVRASENAEGTDNESIRRFLLPLIEKAEKLGITVLIETCGYYSDTARLRDLLNCFSSDSVGALWDVSHPYRDCGEDPEDTIKNLGAFVHHVHVRDSVAVGDSFAGENGTEYRLVGEGDSPIGEFMNALRSVNYDGFLSLEWDPEWLREMDDREVIFSHFVSYMNRFSDTSRLKAPLYRNKSGTGKFIWKKETLIDQTFSDVLDRMCEEFPDQYAVRYTTLDYTRTYTEFREDVDRFARSLIALGVKPGAHVSVWATNIPEWFIAFWATVKIGAVLVTMNTAYKIHEAEYLLRQSDTHTLILVDGYRDADYKEIVKELCPEIAALPADNAEGKPLRCRRLPFLRNIITVGFRLDGCLSWEQAEALSERTPREELRRRAAAVRSSDVCNMQYTSGTTGFPKGVMLTHYNIVNNGKSIGDRMDLSTADRMMIQVPMFHCFGMVLSMTAAMTHGATILPLPYFSPKSALACIDRERITVFHGVPTMFIAMLEHADFPSTDFSYMRTGIMAGSPCPVSVMNDVVGKMHMSEITIVYGQTEASPGCTMSSTDDPLDVRVNTVGRPLPEIECRIVDPETGAELPDNVTGEFVARGYNIMKGYYKMPKATASAIDRDGWLHTGDLACRTPEGNFRITGRLKDMIIRGGENIYPKEIEEFIYTHPKVKDVQVIGVPSEQYGEEIMACIILKDGESMTEQEMKDYVLSHMARHKVPRYIDFVTEFPMNVAGKILKYKMREDAIKKLGLEKAASIVTA